MAALSREDDETVKVDDASGTTVEDGDGVQSQTQHAAYGYL